MDNDMKKVRAFVVLLTTLLWIASAHAADISGTWKLTVNTSAGTGTPTLVVTQTGETLTGTYTGRFGESPITGTFKDGAITFSFDASGPMGSARVTYTGTVAGDTMSGNMQMGEMAGGTFTGKKQA
jgi:hypothetical protein